MRRTLLLTLSLAGCPDKGGALPVPGGALKSPSPKTAVGPVVAAGGNAAKPGPVTRKANSAGAVLWEVHDRSETMASPRCADLNGDGVLDVIMGHGATHREMGGPLGGGGRQPTNGQVTEPVTVTAHDGKDGKLLWRYLTDREIISVPALVDLNGDGTLDAAFGARDGRFFALDGKTGRALWRFQPAALPGAPGRLNFYSAAVVPDLDGDGVAELLQASGGDRRIPPFAPRPPGHLLLISGKTGALLAAARTPDGAETYTSPLLHRRKGQLRIIFGTGGETHAGALWAAPLADLRRGDLSGAKRLVGPTTHKGVVAPPALVDLNGDGVEDIVATFFDGRLVAVDGATDEVLWHHAVTGGETHSSPIVGQFVGGPTPDIFSLMSVGTWPMHHSTYALVVDGETGMLAMRTKLGGVTDATPVAIDTNGDGRDEVFLSLKRRRSSVVQKWDSVTGMKTLWSFAGTSFSTPWVGDIEGDGTPDWVFPYMSVEGGGELSPEDAMAQPTISTLERRTLAGRVSGPVAWGGYLGTEGDARHRPSQTARTRAAP